MSPLPPRDSVDERTPQSGQSDTSAPNSERSRDREALIRQAELVISQVLRGGVLLSALIILIGVVWFYVGYFTTSRAINTAVFPHTLGGVGAGLTHGNPLALIVLGLLVLLATPFARVAVSIVAFAHERDWRYVAITSIVLLILVVSFVLGRGGA